jgi:DNA-binding response OmpR family regulator
MRHVEVRLDDLVVVDANLNDYDRLLPEFDSRELRVRLFATGEDALKSEGAQQAMLWLVNIRLPDMSGICLLTAIRRRWPRARIVITGDVYSADDELAARCAGATAYVCKPPSMAWLNACQTNCRESAGRDTTQTERGCAAALRPP